MWTRILPRLLLLLLLPLLIGCGAAGNMGKNRSVSSDDPPTPGVPGPVPTILTGRVLDEQGQPVEGALVTPTSRENPPVAIPEIAVMTSDQGLYTWHLPSPGSYEITVQKEGYQSKTLAVTAGPGNNNRDFTLRRASE